jgi:hypothetical protein
MPLNFMADDVEALPALPLGALWCPRRAWHRLDHSCKLHDEKCTSDWPDILRLHCARHAHTHSLATY